MRLKLLVASIFVIAGLLLPLSEASAYPPATVSEITQNSLKLGNLNCGKQVRIRIEQRNAANTGWESLTTLTPTTLACPAPAPLPVPNFTWSPANPSGPPVTVTFTSTGTCPSAPCTYQFRHGAPGNEPIGSGSPASFQYQYTGEKTVVLKATDSLGRSVEVTKKFTITAGTTPKKCANGIDDDADGYIDLADKGCVDANDDDESNVVTPPPTTGQPGPSNTGVPAGTNLTPGSGITVRTAGQVISGVDVPYIDVQAPNVIIRNSRISGCGICIVNNSTNLLIEDVTIQGADGTGVMFDNFTARRVNVSGNENGFNAGNNTTITDSWIHDLDTSGDNHTDGIQNDNGASNVLVRHNYIDPVPSGSGCTSPLIHSEGTGTNYRVEDNWLMGGGCSVALYCPRGTGLIMDVVNNRMERGVYGPYTDACGDDRLSGNVDAVTGSPISVN